MRCRAGAATRVLRAFLGHLALAAAGSAATQSYGPGGCVSVTRGGAGSCILRTQCAGQDITSFDFSFNCATSGGVVKHSLGVGSFDEAEEYDTGVACQECLPPQQLSLAGSGASAAAQTEAAKATPRPALRAQKAPPTAASQPQKVRPTHLQVKSQTKLGAHRGPLERFGPGMCVATYRNSTTGHCMMQTDCVMGERIAGYQFGLICEKEDKELVRHVFGKGSFGRTETFDTLIECRRCLALDEEPIDGGAIVKALTEEVFELKGELTNVSNIVARLNARIFPSPKPAPVPAPKNASAKAPPSPSQTTVLNATSASTAAPTSAPVAKAPAPAPKVNAPAASPAASPASAQPAAGPAVPPSIAVPQVRRAQQAAPQAAAAAQQLRQHGRIAAAVSKHRQQDEAEDEDEDADDEADDTKEEDDEDDDRGDGDDDEQDEDDEDTDQRKPAGSPTAPVHGAPR